jgi:CBS-domain-containing membrane protein
MDIVCCLHTTSYVKSETEIVTVSDFKTMDPNQEHPKYGVREYFKKFLGKPGAAKPPRDPAEDMFWSWIGSFLGILVSALLHFRILDPMVSRDPSYYDAFRLISEVGSFLSPWSPSSSHVAYTQDRVYLVGGFGASSVLVYGAVTSPMAQPRNCIGGCTLSAFIGVACR